MAIYGVALLAACYIVGIFLGDVFGGLVGVKANVGGVGFAMLFLILLSNKALMKAGLILRLRAVLRSGLQCTFLSLLL